MFVSLDSVLNLCVLLHVSNPLSNSNLHFHSIGTQALAGRSNVGKSTLLNALLYGNHPRRARSNSSDAGEGNDSSNQHTTNPLVRQFRRGQTPTNVKLPKGIKAVTSDKPGETRKITFYQLASRQGDTASTTSTSTDSGDQQHQKNQKNDLVKLRLVDLPGYGFSFTPKEHDGFQDLLLQYLLDRGKALKRVLLLLDGRHGMKKADVDFIETLQEQAFAVRTMHMRKYVNDFLSFARLTPYTFSRGNIYVFLR